MIYVDIDGVIADFKSWISQYGEFTEEDWAKTDKPWKIMEENIDILYADLPALDLLPHFNNIYQQGNCRFLSALPYQWYETEYWNIAANNKLKWVKKHIDNFKDSDLILTRGANKKIEYCEPGFVLYDDRKDTIEKWIKHGGIGIHIKGRSIQ